MSRFRQRSLTNQDQCDNWRTDPAPGTSTTGRPRRRALAWSPSGLNVVYDTSLAAAVQHLSAGAVRGRVLAVQGLVASLASLAGAPTLGWLADHLGVRLTLAAAGTTAALAVTTGAVVLAGGPRTLGIRAGQELRRSARRILGRRRPGMAGTS